MTLYVNGVEVGGGGGGAPSGPAGGDLGGMYPDPTVTDLTIASEARGDLLRRGASAWQRVAAKTSGSVVAGDGTDVVSVPIATPLAVSPTANLVALGLVASPDLTTGTVVDTGASVGTATATAYTVALASGAVVNDGSKITVPWPVVDTNMTMTGRFVTTGVAAGNRVVYVVVTFGGAAAGNVVRIDVDDHGNVTLKINGAPIVGHNGPATPRTTTWFRVRVDASTLTVWDSSSGVFASPFYTAAQGFLVASGASTYATITSIALTVAQVTTTSDAPTTVVIDNITLRPTA